MMFIGAAVILILIFMFVVLPLFIRFINSVLGTNPIAEDETVFLQPPVISAPVEATNSAQLKIDGYSSAGHEVVVVLNGQEFTRVPATDEGTFSADVELTEGENSLTSYSIDSEANESDAGQNYLIVLDTEDPKLEVTSPKEGDRIDTRDSVIAVEGSTDPGSRIYVNDRTVFPGSDGTFSARHSLKEGKNEILVKARDEAGNETELKLTVEYSP
ncbi:MAG: hypothetical protein QG639_343 [Patescibacteria group bacterium]|nr:hypothetical protein [Patescibacteria group bacterium]